MHIYSRPKVLYWLGASLEDLRKLPDGVKSEVGLDLYFVQCGMPPRDWKPIPEVGAGVREIRNRTSDGAFRTLYVVEKADEVYVLHVFQKKTQKTPAKDIAKGRQRLKLIR